MIIFNYICLIILLIGIGFLYRRYINKYNEHQEKNNYNIIKNYLLTTNTNDQDKDKKTRPIIWIHVKYDYNCREWESFQSRSNYNINIPYQNLTIRSIIDNNKDFNICLIDDNSFNYLIPDWNIKLNNIGDPIKKYMRTICLLKILYYYGGIIVPSSFLCLKNLMSLYKMSPVVVENINKYYTGNNDINYMPDPSFIAAQPKSEIIKDFCFYCNALLSKDNTSESIFLGDYSKWLLKKTQANEIKLIDGECIGIKDNKSNPIFSDDLISTKLLLLDEKKLLGIYISESDFLNNNSLSWFSKIKEDEILDSNMAISKYFIKSNFPN